MGRGTGASCVWRVRCLVLVEHPLPHKYRQITRCAHLVNIGPRLHQKIYHLPVRGVHTGRSPLGQDALPTLQMKRRRKQAAYVCSARAADWAALVTMSKLQQLELPVVASMCSRLSPPASCDACLAAPHTADIPASARTHPVPEVAGSAPARVRTLLTARASAPCCSSSRTSSTDSGSSDRNRPGHLRLRCNRVLPSCIREMRQLSKNYLVILPQCMQQTARDGTCGLVLWPRGDVLVVVLTLALAPVWFFERQRRSQRRARGGEFVIPVMSKTRLHGRSPAWDDRRWGLFAYVGRAADAWLTAGVTNL